MRTRSPRSRRAGILLGLGLGLGLLPAPAPAQEPPPVLGMGVTAAGAQEAPSFLGLVLGGAQGRAPTEAERLVAVADEAPRAARAVAGNVELFGHGMWTDGTAWTEPRTGLNFPGYLSCARVVSAIFLEAARRGGRRWLSGIDSRVSGVERTLAGAGWRSVPPSQARPGDVAIWKQRSGPGNHIGIVVGRRLAAAGRMATIDNLSLTGRPAVRPLHRDYPPGPWVIRRVLRMP